MSEQLFITQPDGYQDGTNRVGELDKAIYGLHQSALAWYDHSNEELQAMDFQPSPSDPCLYKRRTNNGKYQYILVYVDDYTVVASTKLEIDSIFDDLLGVKFTRDRLSRSIVMSQGAAIKKVLTRFGLMNSSPKPTPEVPNLEDLWADDSKPNVNESTYRSMVGST